MQKRPTVPFLRHRKAPPRCHLCISVLHHYFKRRHRGDGINLAEMKHLTNQHRAELRQLATTLLTNVTQYTLRGEVGPLEDGKARSQIVETAQSIAAKLGDGSRERALDDCTKIGEMAAKQLFNAWGVFQQIPLQGSILYTDLAYRVGCDLQLLGKTTDRACQRCYRDDLANASLLHTCG